MKKNNLIYLILIVFNVFLANAQSGNTVLTEDKYETIKFEDVLFTDIKATHGDINQMANLFPVDENPGPQQIGSGSNDPNSVTIQEPGEVTGELYRIFKYNSGLEVAFHDNNHDGELEVIDLKSNSITIDGITLNIGDPISNLTNINYTIKTDLNNVNYINIIESSLSSVTLVLELSSNDTLTKIHYYEIP